MLVFRVGNKFLDLSASIGATPMAPGSKLELAKRRDPSGMPWIAPFSRFISSTSPQINTHHLLDQLFCLAAIDVVLELEEVKCSAQSFSGTTSLWDVLQGFEELSNG